MPGLCRGLTAITGGLFLTIGLLTPLAAVLIILGVTGLAIGLLPPCDLNLFEARLTVVFAAAMLAAVFLLGPGAFSLDARLFGRREIIIPPAHPRGGNAPLTPSRERDIQQRRQE